MKTAWMITGLMLLGMAGCAGTQQVVSGYEMALAKGLNAANDNAIQVWKYQACATPFSAVVRNPEVGPALMSLCVLQGSVGPAELLRAVPATSLLVQP